MYIHVKAHANAKNEKVKQISKDHYDISVKEKAKNNLANKRIIEIIKSLYPRASDVRIMNGHHSPSKLISIDIDEI